MSAWPARGPGTRDMRPARWPVMLATAGADTQGAHMEISKEWGGDKCCEW